MRLRETRKLLLTSLLLLGSALGWAGGFAGNGGKGNGADDIPEYLTSAWFLGKDRVIRACVRGSVDPQVLDSVGALFQLEFAKWKRFIEKNRLNERAGYPALATQLEMRPACQGDEDLVVYYGEETAEVTEAKRIYVNPEGFAHPTFYDDRAGWGRGFIFISPSSKAFVRELDSKRLSEGSDLGILLLHEIGHVFGCGHIDGTVMDVRISDYLTKPAADFFEARRFVDEIEYSRALVTCSDCVRELRAFDEMPAEEDAKLYRELTGRKLRDMLRTQLRIEGSRIVLALDDTDPGAPKGFLESARDLLGLYKAPVAKEIVGTFTAKTELPVDETTPVFKILYKGRALPAPLKYLQASGVFTNSKSKASFSLVYNIGDKAELQITTGEKAYSLRSWVTPLAPVFLGIEE